MKPDPKPLCARLSIRSYGPKPRAHTHDFCQVVIPLHGVIELLLGQPDIHEGQRAERLGPGKGALIQSGVMHRFLADAKACFIVADLDSLPLELESRSDPFIDISDSFLSYCLFIEQQLNSELNQTLEQSIGLLFVQLLAQQSSSSKRDSRIQKVLEYLTQDLSHTPELNQLASIACLSVSQYKNLFRQVTGLSTGQYLLKLRMEKARALLAHTDYPVGIIANKIGYQDASAFSRRFADFFDQSPRDYRR